MQRIIYPLEKYTKNRSDFGWRINPVTGKRDYHDAIDYPAPHGTPIRAVLDGTVSSAIYRTINNPRGPLANWIAIDHANGFSSRYWHLDKVLVQRGQRVKQGDIIGTVGSTGQSTGFHLHFELWKGSAKVNPKLWIGKPLEMSDMYTVKNGDTLGRIARSHKISLDDLLKANPQVSNPNLINVGQQIKIPGKLKSITEIATEVLDGEWGNNPARKQRLAAAGYDPSAVQAEVNKLLQPKSKPKAKSVIELAREVIKGEWGNGAERRRRLVAAGHDYTKVMAEVNRLLR